MNTKKTIHALARPLALAVAMLGAAPQALAQQAPIEPDETGTVDPVGVPAPTFKRLSYGVSLANYGLDETFAAEEGLGENITELAFDLDYRFTQHVAATFSLGAAFLDDKYQFDVRVCPSYDPNCDPETVESGETGVALTAALRADRPIGERFLLEGLGGYKYIRHDRAIADCSDCPDLGSVTMSSPFIGGGIGARVGAGDTVVSFRYLQHLGGDMTGGQVQAALRF